MSIDIYTPILIDSRRVLDCLDGKIPGGKTPAMNFSKKEDCDGRSDAYYC